MCICVYLYMCMYVYVYVCMHMCMHMCTRGQRCSVFACFYVCMCVCTCMCEYLTDTTRVILVCITRICMYQFVSKMLKAPYIRLSTHVFMHFLRTYTHVSHNNHLALEIHPLSTKPTHTHAQAHTLTLQYIYAGIHAYVYV